MSLARSQFFFLRNTSISVTAASCGSKFNIGRATKNYVGVVRKIMNLNSFGALNSRKGTLSHGSHSKRSFSTFSTNGLRSRLESGGSTLDLGAAAEAFKSQQSTVKGRPLNSARSVGYWLIGSASLVFGIVVLGGLTRLTESGLSITEWKPVTGSLPPLNQADWEKEFNLYKDSPEFKILNANMTIDEYKFIYYMEWTHRLWGRFIGLSFVLPAIYFIATKKTSAKTTRQLIGISGLIALQGFIGWWMVKSGLNEKFLDDQSAHPRVSQYRLATHLGAAFVLYLAMVSTGVGILKEARWVSNPVAAFKEFQILNSPIGRRFRKIAIGLTAFTFLTAMSGAFVAGLDAGLIYNSFPYMGNSLTPSSSELFDPVYATDATSKWNLFWKNMLENPVTVQLTHRILATTTFVLIGATHVYTLKYKKQLPRAAMRAGGVAWGLVSLQAVLGISTLIYVVPVPLAAAHQAGALALLTGVLFLATSLKLPRARIQWLINVLVKQAQTQAGKASTSTKPRKL